MIVFIFHNDRQAHIFERVLFWFAASSTLSIQPAHAKVEEVQQEGVSPDKSRLNTPIYQMTSWQGEAVQMLYKAIVTFQYNKK